MSDNTPDIPGIATQSAAHAARAEELAAEVERLRAEIARLRSDAVVDAVIEACVGLAGSLGVSFSDPSKGTYRVVYLDHEWVPVTAIRQRVRDAMAAPVPKDVTP
jgi:hypothetical protein